MLEWNWTGQQVVLAPQTGRRDQDPAGRCLGLVELHHRNNQCGEWRPKTRIDYNGLTSLYSDVNTRGQDRLQSSRQKEDEGHRRLEVVWMNVGMELNRLDHGIKIQQDAALRLVELHHENNQNYSVRLFQSSRLVVLRQRCHQDAISCGEPISDIVLTPPS
ncbi:hypothetical protein B0H17DRAFT_1134025 [Mycena rosella]|uniref:Uncharacterized protein n=1 Tax=Mycena rosella TaxID=1033263 RepID=A0AAD7DGQ5_MYCRO|nr:hypothetical protein B0H17DRAFT_1134025 [Mycena rosella]